MVEAVEIYGLPFMKSNSGLESVVKELAELRFTSRNQAVYRASVAYILSGKTEAAVVYVQGALQALGDRQDRKEYRTFAHNLVKATQR
jgi:hypothetical protein